MQISRPNFFKIGLGKIEKNLKFFENFKKLVNKRHIVSGLFEGSGNSDVNRV